MIQQQSTQLLATRRNMEAGAVVPEKRALQAKARPQAVRVQQVAQVVKVRPQAVKAVRVQQVAQVAKVRPQAVQAVRVQQVAQVTKVRPIV